MPNEFTALVDIKAPGTNVFGYRRGDAVTAQVVDSWQLAVGDDVTEGDLPDGALPVVVSRPDVDAVRAEWERWAVANGMSEQEAAEASMEDLQAVQMQERTAEATRPADSATKATWARWAVAQGADETWAYATGRTKADLMAYEAQPVAGDTIAVAASEALA